MGRHFEVRAAAMAKSGQKKSALYARAAKEIYVAAKGGSDPNSNLALRSAIDKFKGLSVPKDVIERAIKKAEGGSGENYTPGRYEAIGPGGSYLIIDSLSDNTNRAFVNIRTAVTKNNGQMANIAFNFTESGILVFKYENISDVEEALILNDVDVLDITSEDDLIEVIIIPTHFGKAKDLINELGVTDFEVAEIQMVANEFVDLEEEHKEAFLKLLDVLDDVEDVQSVYHNINL
ncbi:MAG: YebC/PmpR family DNA-binding transcriptional regulator, partial [Acholeplasmataceae bacterium]|jgi:YebC/PmpR family DNA-binding regulatory protein|nr:YebC/PmpR family DNA-binding transcriptional regulator [Erysipelotrichia bacterium]